MSFTIPNDPCFQRPWLTLKFDTQTEGQYEASKDEEEWNWTTYYEDENITREDLVALIAWTKIRPDADLMTENADKMMKKIGVALSRCLKRHDGELKKAIDEYEAEEAKYAEAA